MKVKFRKWQRYECFKQEYWNFLKSLSLKEFQKEISSNETARKAMGNPKEWNTIEEYIEHLLIEGDKSRYRDSIETFKNRQKRCYMKLR